MELFSLFLVVSLSMFVMVLLKLGAHSRSNKLKKLNLPPGPPKLPFIGNLHLFAGSHNHHPLQHTLRDLAKKYGSLMHLRLGEVDTIIISSPNTAKLIMKTHDITFANRPSLLLAEDRSYGIRSISLAPYGEYWRQMRKICSLELLTNKRVQSFRNLREEEVEDLCQWIALHPGEKTNLTERISSANYDIMVQASVGKKIDEKVEFIATIRRIAEFLSVFRLADVYPSIKLLPVISGTKRTIDELHQKLDTVLARIVEERKNNSSNRDVGENKQENDLLDLLLNIQSGDESLQLPLTCDNIKFLLAEMFGAGATTSTIVIDWAMAELLNNPETMKKAQDEVRRAFDDGKGGGRVDESCFADLKYLRAVIKETLRMHPPVPLLLPRISRERCEILGYEIPEKTWVLVNAWAIGRDPEYWEDAERFKPERFFEKLQQVDFKGNSFEYIPFGAGRRICPGLLFGVANVEMHLAMFLYHFDWSLADGMEPQDMDMSDHCGGVEGKRKHALNIIPVVRRPLCHRN